jgi:uncharacterized protein
MSSAPFTNVVGSERELRELIGEPTELARRKELDALDTHARAFIAQSPFLLMATADADGRCDVSPKGDAPGFVLVLDDRRLVVPDRPGNRRLDGMRNVLANPRVGLIFLIPGREETLRVNGRAWIVRDEALLDRCAVGGKRPQLALGVEAEEVFLHCAKAFKRSKLWQPAEWPDPASVPSMARMLHDQIRPAGVTVEALEHTIEEGYRTRLY